MLKIIYSRINGVLLADIASVLTLLPLDAVTMATLQANVNFAGGEWTYLQLDNGVYHEEVKITDVSGSYAVAERGVSGSTPRAFAANDTVVSDVVGVDAIKDVIATTPVTADLVVTASGLAYDSNPDPNIVDITVDAPTITGDDSIEILGTWPEVQVTFRKDAGGCCPGEGTGDAEAGVSLLTINSTILQGTLVGNELTLSLQTPTFVGAGGTGVTGEWPNYTITSGSGGGGGSVVSVAVSAGLSLTGNPAVNPTIAIQNTGVVAGIYGGVGINARGQIYQVPAGFSPISEIVVPDGATVGQVGGTVTITFDSADVGVRGLVELADDGAPLDPLDTTSAVTPALLAASIGGSSGSDAAGSGTGEADATYTDVQAATIVNVSLAAGEKALLVADVQVMDGTTPLAPVAYGIAVFDSSNIKRAASKICTQSTQSLLGILTGPFTGTVNVVTTALPAGSTLQGAHLAVIKL